MPALSTSIGGNLDSKVLRSELERVKHCFPEKASGFCAGRSTRFLVEVTPVESDSFISIVDRSESPMRDYLSPEDAWRKGWGLPLTRPVALLFPHHRLAFVMFPFDLHYTGQRELLEQLGYVVATDREVEYSDLTKKNQLRLLEALRSPQSPALRAIDIRAHSILDALRENLEEEVKEHTFGVFTPTWKKTIVSEHPNSDGYGGVSRSTGERLVVKKHRKLITLPISWSDEGLEKLAKGLPVTKSIALCSRVRTRDGVKHIPMIDFAGRSGIDEALEKIGIPGMLVNSGNSYHFYGFRLLNGDGWWSFMKRLKDMSAVDKYWPDYQLEQGYNLLRLTPSRGKLYQPCLVELYRPSSRRKDINGLESLSSAA